MKKNPDALSFVEHLDELRGRLIKMILAVIVASCVAYGVIDRVFHFLTKPVGQLVFTSPADAFLARITLAICAGIFLALPVILYQIWAFVSAGLKKEEKRFVYVFAPCSFFLFMLGGLFAYFVTIPIAIRFLLSFSTETIVPMITIRNYISFLGTMLLAFGLVFELPLILMFLTKIGVATPDFFVRKRRYAVVIILIVSAVITPPDVITQLIMAGPLVLLYEIGIMATRVVYKKDRLSK